MKKLFDFFKKRFGCIVEKQGNAPTLKSTGKSLTLSGSMIDAENIDFVKAMTKKNLLRITTSEAKHFPPIKAEYFPLIEEAFLRADGCNAFKLKNSLQLICGISEKEAALIACGLIAKIHGQLTLERMKAGGITKAKWNHSGAGRAPREYHNTKWDGVSHNPPNGLDGYIFDINNPPIADLETGEHAVPSELFDCKCVATPIIEVVQSDGSAKRYE